MGGLPINADITVKLYKTASNVSIGTVGSAVTLAFVNTTFNSPLTSDSSTSIGLYLYGFTVTQATCMVVNRNLQVTLDPVSRFIFNGVGSTTNQGAKDFNISVKCQKSTNVKMQIDGVNTFDASKGVLGEESGHEIGVGIQLLYKDIPITFGSAFDVGTVNPTLDIPLKARYYQTASTINPGTIGSFATFTMTYN
ncbi:fimbrial protein [Orbus mooreae]|uniref:fimbrial protein n=1 Tax=Orbus mooreae TaxID=3074107 RepID=UPI00370D5A8B